MIESKLTFYQSRKNARHRLKMELYEDFGESSHFSSGYKQNFSPKKTAYHQSNGVSCQCFKSAKAIKWFWVVGLSNGGYGHVGIKLAR